MSSPARKLNNPSGQRDLQKLESELLSLPFIVRRHLAHALLESVDEGGVEPISGNGVLAGVRVPEEDVEAAWAEEAHRRWEAYQRGEEEMLDFDDVMAEIRASFRQ
ncbi:MAG TPA: addiction module protein [Longimicrobium sp.]|nr:addiction module protein [Longimicrobium sp.]